MKKIFWFVILILLTIFPFNSVKATKGCCSGHGGVNCNKIQSNGRVVCNDGWTGSSCSYSSMAMCNGYNPSSGNNQKHIYGCTDKTAKNYNSKATKSDNSCKYYIYGCTDINSDNYNSKADKDDGSCIKKIYGCMDKKALNYNDKANTNDNSCKYEEQTADFSNEKNKENILKETSEDNSTDVIVGIGVLGTISTVIYLVVKKKI